MKLVYVPLTLPKRQNSVVQYKNLATDWATRDRGKIIIPAPKCPDRLWGAPSLLFNEYRGSSPGEKLPGSETDH